MFPVVIGLLLTAGHMATQRKNYISQSPLGLRVGDMTKVAFGRWNVSRNGVSNLVLLMPLKEMLHSFTTPFPWTGLQTRRGTILDRVEDNNILKTEEKEQPHRTPTAALALFPSIAPRERNKLPYLNPRSSGSLSP